MHRMNKPNRQMVPRRGGAVIIVVLALLSLMLFLGVFFFEFAQEEQQTSEHFAGANLNDVVDPDPTVSEALEQVILGPRSRPWSVFAGSDSYLDNAGNAQRYGNPHSILAHVLGPVETGANGATKHGRPMDVIPHNGRGIRVIYGPLAASGSNTAIPAGAVRFDHDGDGIHDSTLNLALDPGFTVFDPVSSTNVTGPEFAINFSQMAQPDVTANAFSQTTYAQRMKPYVPDTDYTQADINSLFLAHEEWITDSSGNRRRVLIPSFFRPTMFPTMRDIDGSGALYSSLDPSGFRYLFSNNPDPTVPKTTRRVLRPHELHRYPNGLNRYLTSLTAAQSGDTDRLIGQFLFSNNQDGDANLNEMGIFSSLLPSASSATLAIPESDNYELDVDVDGDGDYDGIWMDLGMDVVDLPDGRQFVPLVSFFILDADGLANVNVHGNTQGILNPAFNLTSSSISVSNQGLTPQEVNLMRLFSGDPSLFSGVDLVQAQSQYASQYPAYAFPANAAQSPVTLANMDLLFLLTGRRQVVNGVLSSPMAGRFGEEALLLSGSFPRAGVTGIDDDNDQNIASSTFDGGRSRSEPLYDPKDGGTASVVIPPYVHPISLSGQGSDVVSISTAEKRNVLAPAAGNPSVWPNYSQYYEDPAPAGAGVKPMSQSDYPALMANTSFQSTLDEENEVIASHDQRNRVYDSLFDPSENVFLQCSEADYQRSGARSRLDQLLPFNLRSSRDALNARKRFTTDSWDINQMAYVNLRANESSAWTPTFAATRRFFPPMFASQSYGSAQDPFRPELRYLLASETTFSTSQIGAGRTLLRQQLNINRLLVGFDSSGNPIYRNLMPHPDIVELEYQDTSNTMPAITIPAMIHDHTASPPVSLSAIQAAPGTEAARATSATAQEWWARYDRQRLARDIYTLLYLTGATNNDSPTNTPYSTTNYPDRRRLQGVAVGGNGNGNANGNANGGGNGNGNGQANGQANGVSNVAGNGITENVEEMAQFAVNFVDALDRDDVITTFEYDANLADGWNTPTQKVYGVERQSLTISEALLWQLQRITAGGDRSQTLFTEDSNSHQILHVELRNASPFTVEVGEGWRILRVPTNNATPDMWYSFKTRNFGTATASVKSVAGGNNFLVSSRDPGLTIPAGGATATSDLWANIDADSDLECVVPRSTSIIADNQQNPAPKADIDLSQITAGLPHQGYAQAGTPAGGYTGTLVQETTGANPTAVTFDLVLQRRQNLRGIASAPSADAATESTGRWIEVDRFAVNSSNMGPSEGSFNPAGNTATDIQTTLANLHSRERTQPFVPRQYSHPDTGSMNHTLNADAASKHAANQALIGLGLTQFTIWQPHFDRDFTSIYELLSIPLYGSFPTADINTDYNGIYSPEVHGGPVINLAKGDLTATGRATLAGDLTAGVRFLFPNGEPAHPYQGWNPVKYSNDWYRLFGFIQVPRRTEQADPTQYPNTVAGAIKPLNRVPGLINLNTLRDESILAALLDDDLHFPMASARSTTNDQISAGRNWYTELRVSRDGVDALMTAAGLPSLTIPGTMNPASPGGTIPVIYPKPFRSLGHVDLDATNSSDNGIEATVLRSRPLQIRPAGPQNSATDMTTVTPAGGDPWNTSPANLTDWQSLLDARDLANNQMDYHTRNRLLAKAANNSTTKSHVFYVWVAVGYFEAHQVTVSGTKYPQIGARMTDLPIQRVFTMIDMSRLEEAYDPFTKTFDFNKFVIHRKRLR